MQQTFLGYVTSDSRFWAASLAAILRSVFVPAAVFGTGLWFTAGPAALTHVAMAVAAFALADWCVLVCRMARRVALGLENPNALLERSVLGNARYLYRGYMVGPMPSLEQARG